MLRRAALFIRKQRIARRIVKNRIQIDNSVSIISNNCTGGVMYNDLLLEFKSPTINLYFKNALNFVNFVNNLKEYLTNGVLSKLNKKESKSAFPDAPIGLLHCEGLDDIEIHFLHYQNFDEAKHKWQVRSQRVNFDNIFLVIEAKDDDYKKAIDALLNLPYRKIIFTDINHWSDNVLNMPFYKKYGTGEKCPILKITSLFGKRGYDDYDFIKNIFKKV